MHESWSKKNAPSVVVTSRDVLRFLKNRSALVQGDQIAFCNLFLLFFDYVFIANVINESFQVNCTSVMLEFLESFAFDLTNSLTCDFEDSSGFFKSVAVAVTKPVTQLDDFAFTVSQALENVVDLISQHLLGG